MRIMIAVFIALFLAAATASAQTYQVKGSVISIQQAKGDVKCYVAIRDPANPYYSEGYHLVDDRQICAMANAAFVTGAFVRGRGKVRRDVNVNEFDGIELSKASAKPYWPPYGRNSKSGE
jgi:hypothetical protein